MTTTPDRHARRREATRAKLVEAAKALFARQGVDTTRINEITDEADVGFGSFYNHFESKEAIVEAVLADTIAAQGAAIDAITARLEDPAEIIAAAHRHFVRRARTDPGWALAADPPRRLARHRARVARAVRAARPAPRRSRAGRLQVSDERTALFAMGGAMLAVMRAVLDGDAPKNADVHHAEGVLRLLGLTASTPPRSPAGRCRQWRSRPPRARISLQ